MYLSCSLILSCMHFRIINVKFAVLNLHPIHVLLHLISWLNSFRLGPREAGVGGGGMADFKWVKVFRFEKFGV